MNKKQILSICLAFGILTVNNLDAKIGVLNKNLPNLFPCQTELTVLPLELDALNTATEAEDIDTDETPDSELYSVWNNSSVNPYKVELDSLLAEEIQINFDKFSFPLPKHYRVTSEFGPRRYRYHYGIDLKVERGDSVVSVLDGRVRIAKKMNGYGNVVVVRHNNGTETFYGHLDKILVQPDQNVSSGEMIGHGGNTGRSTGPHLHFELRYMGHPINPRDMIDFEGLCAKSDNQVLSLANFEYKKDVLKFAANKYNKRGKKAKKMQVASKSSSNKAIASTKSSKSSGRSVTIKSGDTLGHIAQKTGVSVSKLRSLNGITKDKNLKIGQKIKY